MGFWTTEPVGLGNKEGVIECPVICNQLTTLPNGYKWAEISDPQEICDFLQKYYIDDGEFRLIYGVDFFEDIFNNTNFNPSLSIALYNEISLIGYVLAVPRSFKSSEMIFKGAIINFLCVSTQYRSKGLATYLIKEIKRRCYNIQISQALFCGLKNWGFSFTTACYHHKLINYQKLIKLGFAYPGLQNTGKYSLREDTRVADDNDLSEIYQIYKEGLSNYKIVEYYSEDEFKQLFKPNSNVRFVLYNSNIKEFVIVNISKVLSLKQQECFKTGMIVHWHGSNEIVKDAIAYAKQVGIDVLDSLDLGRNNQFIEDLNFLSGTGKVNYYFFNRRIDKIPQTLINIILP